MPRTFTENEREYMARLAARNTLLDETKDESEYHGSPEEGEESPMPATERMRRKRIREKADTAVRDLVTADTAGVIDLHEQLQSHELAAAMAVATADSKIALMGAYYGEPAAIVSIDE